jgi:hypothetical protein
VKIQKRAATLVFSNTVAKHNPILGFYIEHLTYVQYIHKHTGAHAQSHTSLQKRREKLWNFEKGENVITTLEKESQYVYLYFNKPFAK